MNIKKVMVLLITLLLMCGCESISNKDIDINIDTILTKKYKYVNENAIGYQYYLPSGINVKEVRDFNEILYTSGNTYYLYADIVSYYHKTKKEYKINKKAYISKKLSYGKNNGYLEVNNYKGKYYVEMMYNYAKIESVVPKHDLKDTITNMCYILSTVKYNDNIVKKLLGDSKYNLSENEDYNIFDSKKTSKEDNFLNYINEYDKYDGEVKDLMDKKDMSNKNKEE